MKHGWFDTMDDSGEVLNNKVRRERCKYCLDGALQTICLTHPNASRDSEEFNSYDAAYNKMQDILAQIIEPGFNSEEECSEDVVTGFNDKVATTHKQILGVLQKSINSLTKETK